MEIEATTADRDNATLQCACIVHSTIDIGRGMPSSMSRKVDCSIDRGPMIRETLS